VRGIAGAAIVAVALASALAPAGAAPAAAGKQVIVKMTDGLQFKPQKITINIGDRVVWKNVGSIAHTVTTLRSEASNPRNASVPSKVKPWDSGFIAGARSYARVFRTPGVYRYFCVPHEGAHMVGVIVVK
jgi:plastocyanin